jgi:hypothetical protein
MRNLRWVLQLPQLLGNLVVLWSGRQVTARPRLKMRAMALLARHPGIKKRLRPLAVRAGLAPGALADPMLLSIQRDLKSSSANGMPDNLSPRAARIYAELRRAIEASKR